MKDTLKWPRMKLAFLVEPLRLFGRRALLILGACVNIVYLDFKGKEKLKSNHYFVSMTCQLLVME